MSDKETVDDVHGFIEVFDAFHVRGWAACVGAPEAENTVLVHEHDTAMLVQPHARADVAADLGLPKDTIGFYGVLPGWVWQGVDAPRQGITLRPFCGGREAGTPIHVARAMVLAHIAEMLEQSGEHIRTFDALLALEHVSYGHMWPDLSSQAQSILIDIARAHGLSQFLPDADADKATAEAVQTLVEVPARYLALSRTRDLFGALVRAQGDTRRLEEKLRHALAEHPLDDAGFADLAISVTTTFCRTDSYEDLYDLMQARLPNGLACNGGLWHDSAVMPYVARRDYVGEIVEFLAKAAQNENGWIEYAALADAIGYCLFDAKSCATLRQKHDLIYALIGFVEERGKDHWSRVHSVELIDVVAQCLLEPAEYDTDLRAALERCAIGIYGLSHQFWETALGKITRLPVALAVAHGHFTAIQDALQNQDSRSVHRTEAALAFFGRYENPEAQRFRYEIMAAFPELAGRSQTDAAQAIAAQALTHARDANDELLRRFAAPGAPDVDDEELQARLRHVVARRNDKAEMRPRVALRRKAVAQMVALLSAHPLAQDMSETSEGTPSDALSPVLATLRALSTEDDDFVGLGFALRLLSALLHRGAEPEAARLAAFLSEVLAAFETPDVDHSAAILSGLNGLLHKAICDTAAARQARALFGAEEARDAPSDYAVDFDPAQGALGPLFDMLVVVCSCHANLDRRIPKMRDSWLPLLQELGVPYVIVVGDGDGRLEGDVVHLQAPDDYEGLPFKTLAALQWVQDNTPFAHVFKVDDDCLLSPQRFFDSIPFAEKDFFGRPIHRGAGDTDRAWHFEKSATLRGQREIDKSPEPSAYCDGGSGYVLSRRAFGAVLDTIHTPQGQHLILSSFMEDKLVGDLLRASDIHPSGADYTVAIQRRTHPQAIPVSRWENGFHPGPLSPTALVHLDTADTMASVTQALPSPKLWPRKIWPTFERARLGYDTNALELVSTEAQLEKVNATEVAVVACVRNEMFMLPHFLAHYRRLGVSGFLMVDNCSDDGTLEYLHAQPDVALFSTDTNYRRAQYGVSWQMAVVSNLRVGRWSLMADADELLTYAQSDVLSLPDLLQQPQWQEADAGRVLMLDMYPKGPLQEADFASGDPFTETGYVDRAPFLEITNTRGPFGNAPAVTSALRHRLIPNSPPELFIAQKYALLRYAPWMRPSAGLHFVGDIRPGAQDLLFAHFKYNAAFFTKAKEEAARGQHFNNAEEYRRYLALKAEGRSHLYEEGVSVPWRSCEAVRRILEAE